MRSSRGLPFCRWSDFPLQIIENGGESIVYDGIQAAAKANVLIRTAAEHREDDALPDTFNKAVHDDIVWNFLTFKVFSITSSSASTAASTILL